eukprot:1510747-Rhodomonas_salina.1
MSGGKAYMSAAPSDNTSNARQQLLTQRGATRENKMHAKLLQSLLPPSHILRPPLRPVTVGYDTSHFSSPFRGKTCVSTGPCTTHV